MFEYRDSSKHPSHDELLEILKVLEAALIRYFNDDWLVLDGCAMHVDEVIEALERYIAQIECAHTAFSTWFEDARVLRDEIRYEIRPLLAGIREFVVEEFGADSPLIREFGFEPVPRSSCGEDDDGEVDEDDRDELMLC